MNTHTHTGRSHRNQYSNNKNNSIGTLTQYRALGLCAYRVNSPVLRFSRLSLRRRVPVCVRRTGAQVSARRARRCHSIRSDALQGIAPATGRFGGLLLSSLLLPSNFFFLFYSLFLDDDDDRLCDRIKILHNRYV
jgi:hypothetical protein